MSERYEPPAEPVFDALVRPATLFGCDPRVFSLSATVCGLMVYAAVMRLQFVLGVVGAGLFVVSWLAMNRLREWDLYGLDVWLRSLRYAYTYDAAPRWDAEVPKRKRSWR